MDNIHSIIIIKKDNRFLNYYDERWKTYLFPNITEMLIPVTKGLYTVIRLLSTTFL